MKTSKTILILSALVALLAAVAAGAGVFGQGQGSPVPFTTPRGDTVLIQGHGLYRFDSVSGAAQAESVDTVTLVLGIPLLLLSIGLAGRGSLRGRLLLSGTLGYFLYTYTSVAFMQAYNPLFLLYVTLFSLSLFTFVLSLMSFDIKALPAYFSEKIARIPVAGFLFLIGAFLALNWIGNVILPALASGHAPDRLDSYTTLVIQAMDLGLIVPAAFLAGVLWLRRSVFGYLLVPVLLVKGMTMSAALFAMIVGMIQAGVAVSAVEVIMFPALGLINVVVLGLVLKNVRENPAAVRAAVVTA
jgi:hypothetical protein